MASADHLDVAARSSSPSFAPLTPELCISLHDNKLSRLPFQLFDLEHLTILSLSNNNLSELPSSIGRLRKLRHLNVNENKLRYLPGSILQLCSGANAQLNSISRWGNPIIKPTTHSHHEKNFDVHRELFLHHTAGPQSEEREYWPIPEDLGAPVVKWIEAIRTELKSRWISGGSDPHKLWSSEFVQDPIFVTSTPVTYYDTNGVPLTGQKVAASTDAQIIASLGTTSLAPGPTAKTPSLLEHCLRICSQSPDLPMLTDMMPPDTAETVIAGIGAATSAAYEGGATCSTCGKAYVLPRAEWLEFVFHLPDLTKWTMGFESLLVPFIQRVCSWACAKPRGIVSEDRL